MGNKFENLQGGGGKAFGKKNKFHVLCIFAFKRNGVFGKFGPAPSLPGYALAQLQLCLISSKSRIKS